MKIGLNDSGHMTKMVAKSIYGKNLSKYFLLLNRWTDFHKTSFVGSVTQA